MNKIIQSMLISNAASLGFHWVYDPAFLSELSKKESLLFRKQDESLFKKAKNAFFVYGHLDVGGLTTQGMFAKWLYQAWNEKSDFNRSDYDKLIYEQIRPGGPYHGYIETYGKALIYNHVIDELSIPADKKTMNDQHLVGMIPYLVSKALNHSKEQAWDLAQLFTDDETYLAYYDMLDVIFTSLEKATRQQVLKNALDHAPKNHKEALEKALSMTDTETFIKSYAGIACQISHSMPLVMHLLYHGKDFEQILEWNTRLGGASAERGLVLGALLSVTEDIPQAWIEKTQIH